MCRYLNILVLTFILLLAVGCMGTANLSAQASSLTTKLNQQGVQVVEVGETVSVIIPSDILFQNGSANLDPHADYCLNLVADFLNTYSKTFVEIAGYTDHLDNGSHEEKSLTARQAAQVLHTLWARGIDSRMLYAIGYGAAQPMSNDSSPGGNTKNRRIEIHFQYNKLSL